MAVQLRAHHVLCILTYVGKGYSADFVANYNQVIQRLMHGESILLVEGPDDICWPLVHSHDAHCHTLSVQQRDQQAASDLSKLLGQPISPGLSLNLSLSQLSALRQAFERREIRTACTGCEWSGLCTQVAHTHFEGVRLLHPIQT